MFSQMRHPAPRAGVARRPSYQQKNLLALREAPPPSGPAHPEPGPPPDRPHWANPASHADVPRVEAIDRIVPHIFTTRFVSPREQCEAWREWFSAAFEVVPKEASGEGFRAENKIWRLGDLIVSQVSGPAVEVVRRKTHLRRTPADHWVLSYCREGVSIVRTGNGSVMVPARTPYLWSLGAESGSVRTAADRLQFYLPRDSFHNIAPLLDAAVGVVLDTPLGTLLGEFMLSLERNLGNLTGSDVPRLAEAVGGLVAASVGPSAERMKEAQGVLAFGRMERVRRAVQKYLRSAALRPETLCRMVGTSRSQLYRMLEGSGGAARYIQRQRLLEAHRILSDTSLNRPIFVISEDLCFEDASSFSRAFRREFGLSPSDVRAGALAGAPPATMSGHSARPEATSFSALLRGV